MTASSPHELGELRARAYGPHADIDADPHALARLRQLEDAALAERRAAQAATAADAAEPAPAATSAAAPPSTVDGVTVETPVFEMPAPPAAPPAPRPIARAWIIAWAASVLVVAVAVGGIVFGLASIKPVSAATGATQVASLTEPVETPEWMSQWFGRQEAVAYRYRGLIVARAVGAYYGAGADSECLFVADESGFNESDGSISGQVFTGCGVSTFPATVQFLVDGGSADGLREAFPDGTALQFVLNGDTVGVFVSDAPSPTPTVIAVD